jgi:hypothetical protein
MPYIDIATQQLRRGFPTCPTTDKHGLRWNQFSAPASDSTLIRADAANYPDGQVGVAGTRGVGNLCFLDIDSPGLAERIEQETNYKIPHTYAVQSSPVQAPYKMHFYFFQTDYLLKKFKKRVSRKNPNDRQINIAGKPFYKEMYALKGIGGGDFVVAAGNTFEKDGVRETYTIKTDAAVTPIPDWLVDWIANDFHQSQSDVGKAAHRYRSQETLKENSRPDGEIYEYAKWRISQIVGPFQLKNRKQIISPTLKLITAECRKTFEGGRSWLANPENVNRLRGKIMTTPVHEFSGYDRKRPVRVDPTVSRASGESIGGMLITPQESYPRGLIAQSLHGIRTPASSNQVRARARTALMAIGVELTNARLHRNWISRACRDVGLIFEQGYWHRGVKLTDTHPTTQQHYIYRSETETGCLR